MHYNGQKIGGQLTVGVGRWAGNFTAIAEVQGTIEMNLVALRMHPHNGCLPDRCPHAGQRGLEVQAHLI
jgi:hypothetical protein